MGLCRLGPQEVGLALHKVEGLAGFLGTCFPAGQEEGWAVITLESQGTSLFPALLSSLQS